MTCLCFAIALKPCVNLPTTSLAFQWRIFSKLISGGPKETPCCAVSSASVMTLAVCKSALDGMQPTLRHTPPRVPYLSMRMTFLPKSAARNAAV